MGEQFFLQVPEIILIISVLISMHHIVIEYYMTVYNRILYQNNFFIIIILLIILFTISSLILIKGISTNTILFLMQGLKINKSTQILKIIMLSSYLILNIILNLLANIEKEIKLDHLILLNILILNSFFIIGCKNLIELLLCLEINNLIFIILITTKNYQLGTIEAAFKYFLISAVSAVLFLLGTFFVYSYTGHITFDSIQSYLTIEQTLKSSVFSSQGVETKITMSEFYSFFFSNTTTLLDSTVTNLANNVNSILLSIKALMMTFITKTFGIKAPVIIDSVYEINSKLFKNQLHLFIGVLLIIITFIT